MESSFLETALATGKSLGEVQQVPGLRPLAIVPPAYRIESLESFNRYPDHIRQTVRVFTPESFVLYFQDFEKPESRVFIDTQAPSILGVLDYHAPLPDGEEPLARWTGHRVQYVFRPTKEWTAWKSQDGANMTQSDFAHFIEDNLPDIVDPPAADMFDVVKTLEAKKDVNFSSAIRLENNAVQFKYEETISGTANRGKLEIPAQFNIAVAPFEGALIYKVGVRFRYRISEKGLVLRYELIRPHKVIEDAVQATAKTISDHLGPEAQILHGGI